MDDKTKTALMIGVPVGLALLGGAIYIMTRPPQNGNGVCQQGTVLMETCPDGSQVTTHQCMDGAWIPTGQVCVIPPVQTETGTLYSSTGVQTPVQIDTALILRGTDDLMFVKECYMFLNGDINVLLDAHMGPQGNRYVWSGSGSPSETMEWLDNLGAAGQISSLQVDNAKIQIGLYLQRG